MADRRKQQIREIAHGMGFVACGFAPADRLPDEALLRQWLAEGRHGDMRYLDGDLDRRLEPQRYLDGAATVIVLAWPYPAPRRTLDLQWRQKLTGRIAAYARGIDYHSALVEKLDELSSTVSSSYGGTTRAHVDAGPLLEKSLAQRAGLGWYGRNTNILLPDRGSLVLLACLLCESSIEPDPPYETDHCGACTACIPACPTDAIGRGRTIDAPRCLSYLTIEHRGPIDESLRPAMGNWIFGCDDCQTSCPWNEEDEAEDPWLNPYLPDVLTISREEFREIYRKTAVSRTKRRGLVRNAAVALGNSGNPDAIDPLARALAEHDEALVRAHAAWALGRFPDPSALQALLNAAAGERVPPVREAIDAALGQHRLRSEG